MEIEIKLGIFVSVFHFHTTMINFVFCKNCFYACIHQSRCRRVCCSLEDYHRKVLMHTTIYICTLYPIEPPTPQNKTKQKTTHVILKNRWNLLISSRSITYSRRYLFTSPRPTYDNVPVNLIFKIDEILLRSIFGGLFLISGLSAQKESV